MSKKIYISPSSQPENRYAVGNTNEQEQCRKIAAALQEVLDRCGFTAYAGLSGTMYTRVAESNKLGVVLHMPIHTNASNGKVSGLRIFVSKLGGEAEEIAKAIMATLAPITPGTSDGIQVKPELYEIKATKAICVYIEVGFHDNPEEAKWIVEHTEDIAKAIAQGLCNHYGAKYIDQAAENTSAGETKAEATTTTSKKATEAAKSFLKSLAGTYKVTASALNVRNGAGITKKVMTTIPKGTEVKCYGYYTAVLGVKWLYIQFTYNGVTYTGFASAAYLKK